jgi:pyridinium-3,5-biscarboxylic acid mononucleotide synthase
VGRAARIGDPEVVFGTGKTSGELVSILRQLSAAHPDRAVLATRRAPEHLAACRESLPGAVIDERGGTVVAGPLPEPPTWSR